MTRIEFKARMEWPRGRADGARRSDGASGEAAAGAPSPSSPFRRGRIVKDCSTPARSRKALEHGDDLLKHGKLPALNDV